MNIVFVVGGSYKAFYLNNLNKLKDVDLLIFQEDILYDFDYYNENFELKTVSNEMMNLAEILNCKIVAIVNTNLCGVKKKEILYADKDKICLIDIKNYLSLIIKNKVVNIAVEKTINRGDVSIRLDFKKANCKLNYIEGKRVYIHCNKSCVKMVKNSKIRRKFRKICYFCLRF